MKYKILGISIIFITLVCGCIGYGSMQLVKAKHSYALALDESIAEFVDQQQNLLQKLSQQLTPYLLSQNIIGISQILHMAEDQLYVLAKQGLTIPVSLQFVSLNAPQQIINSAGVADSSVLAPDEDYYRRVVAQPQIMQWSKIYTQDAMPQYGLLNIGYGIVLDQQYLGHLDVQFAVSAFETYVMQTKFAQSKIFSVEFRSNIFDKPRVSLKPEAYWLEILQPTLYLLACIIAILTLLIFIYRLYAHAKHLAIDLLYAEQKALELQDSVHMYNNILSTQYKYGVEDQHHTQMIHVQQLLNDVSIVNADLIKQRNIVLNLPTQMAGDFYIHANRLSLMRILSGILYEILLQLPNNSMVSLQVAVHSINAKKQKLVFKFTDNGFYAALQDNNEVVSNFDVRAKGWSNIQRLIALESGVLDHVHTAYVGNTISLSIEQSVITNVISLAF